MFFFAEVEWVLGFTTGTGVILRFDFWSCGRVMYGGRWNCMDKCVLAELVFEFDDGVKG